MTAEPRVQPGLHRHRKVGTIVLALTLHGIVLTPLALNLNGSKSTRPAVRRQTPIYIDIESRPRLSGETDRIPTAPARTPRPATDRPLHAEPAGPSQPAPSGSAPGIMPLPQPPTDRGRWQVRPDGPGAHLGALIGRGTSRCRAMAGRADLGEQAYCDQLFAEAAANSPPLTGTNNPARDARFAAIGDQALADYDRRRAPLKPNSRANPCPESPTPGDPCAFTIKGRIWSNRDGWLPDLPGRQ